jgi:hypothetical protein
MERMISSQLFRLLQLVTIPILLVLGGKLNDAQGQTSGHPGANEVFEWQAGDIVFQGGTGTQARAIETATGSSWTHCGIVLMDENGPYVVEAVQPVRRTELKAWLERGNGVYSVKRLVDETVLTPAVLEKMRQTAHGLVGRNYDIFFQWDDERIYCSELVWKVYQQSASLEVAEMERFGDMDLAGPEARQILKQRFANGPPLDEPVISPGRIHRSALLRTVKERPASIQ